MVKAADCNSIGHLIREANSRRIVSGAMSRIEQAQTERVTL